MSSFTFNNYSNLEELTAALKNDLIHVCKELLVVTIMNISSDKQELELPQVIALVPICNKDNNDFMPNAFKFVHEYFQKSNCILVNTATDGDSNRRAYLNKLRKPICSLELEILKSLKLFDQNLLFGSLSINYDSKHCVKRVRGVFTSDKRSMTVDQESITNLHIEMYFKGKNWTVCSTQKINKM